MSRLSRLLPKATEGKLLRVRATPLAVVEFESPSASVIAAPIPKLSRATNLFVFLLVISLLLATAVIPVDKIVSANGKLVADAPNIVIQSFGESIVESIEVAEGDVVRKGQVLVRLNPTFATADLTTIRNQVELLNAKADRLQAVTSGLEYAPVDAPDPHVVLQASIFKQEATEYNFTLLNYDQRIDQLRTKIAGDTSQAAFYGERLKIATSREDMQTRLLESEAGSKLDALTARDDRLVIQAAHAQAQSDAAQAGRELAAQRAERGAFVQSWNGKNLRDLAETRSQLLQAQQALAKVDLQNELLVLTAPRDAIVLSVSKVSMGSVIKSGAPLLRLVPMDAQLSAEVNIAGIDSGYVRSGHEVRIKFDTLPFLQYGSATGSVRAISADSFSPETAPTDGESAMPNRPRMLYYRGDIDIGTLELHNTPPGFRLMPGMPLIADVKVGTRSVLDFFIGSIMPVVQDSMHEP